MTVCLSPNGSTVYEVASPATELLVGTADGITRLQRTSLTGSWQMTEQALRGLHVSSILFEPVRGGLFAGIHGEGLYFSADGGHTWQSRMEGLSERHVFTLASVQGSDGIVLYAGTEPAHLFRSFDYGETWSELTALRQVADTDRWTFPAPPHIGHVKTIAIDPRDADTLFVGIEQGALLKSTDGGQTFRELTDYSKPEDSAYRDIHRVLQQRDNPDCLYMTGGIGLYTSQDAGETWEHRTDRTFRIGYPDQMVFSPQDNQVVFMCGSATNPGVWRKSHHADATVVRSGDGGRTWQPSADGLPEHMRGNIEAMSLGNYPGGFDLFLATTNGDVFASSNAGARWDLIVSEIPAISKGGHYQALQATAA